MSDSGPLHIVFSHGLSETAQDKWPVTFENLKARFPAEDIRYYLPQAPTGVVAAFGKSRPMPHWFEMPFYPVGNVL
jgi:hypothetical protein